MKIRVCEGGGGCVGGWEMGVVGTVRARRGLRGGRATRLLRDRGGCEGRQVGDRCVESALGARWKGGV